MIKLSQAIDHEGVVLEVRQDTLIVSIAASVGCATCRVKGLCIAADKQKKIIEVLKPSKNFFKNDRIQVQLKEKTVLSAIFVGYVLPVIFLVATLLLLLTFGFSEFVSGAISLLSLAMYYGFLFSQRNALARKFQFFVKI